MAEEKSIKAEGSGNGQSWIDTPLVECNIALTDSDQVSRIIGTRGLTIKKICSDSGTYISFSKDNQIGTVRGKKESISKAISLIAEELEKEGGNKVSLDLVIPESEVGKVIGKKGVTIKRLEEENGASISVTSGINGQQPVKITGSAEGVSAVSDYIVRCVDFDATPTGGYMGYVGQGRQNPYKQYQMAMGVDRYAAAADYIAQMEYQAASQAYGYRRGGRGSGNKRGMTSQQPMARARWVSPGQVECNIALENPEEVSKIIGSQGKTIKSICSESSTWISFSKDNQIGTIRGKKENLVSAIQLMMTELSDNDASAKLVISLLVPSPEVAKIIGKRGVTIKKIEEDSGAAISISAGLMQLVKLTGTAEAVVAAADRVIQIVDFSVSASVTSPPRQNSEHSSEMEQNQVEMKVKVIISEEFVSAIIGHRGEGIKYIARTSGVRISFSREQIYEAGTETGTITGRFSNIICALKFLGQKIQQAAGYGNLYSMTMVVPSETIGWIIGKGGSTIQETIRRSGAKISVSKERKKLEMIEIEESLITIEGSTAAVDVACYSIIQQLSRFRSL